MKNQIIIFAYCFATFACGLIHISNVLLDDIKTQSWQYGRVSLIASYWYEHYKPNRLFKWYKENIDEPITVFTCDKVAASLYPRKYNIVINGSVTPGDKIYLLSAYMENKLSESRINKDLQFHNIYKAIVK